VDAHGHKWRCFTRVHSHVHDADINNVANDVADFVPDNFADILTNASLQHGNSQQLPKPSKSALSC
jgi:hypothetical protein